MKQPKTIRRPGAFPVGHPFRRPTTNDPAALADAIMSWHSGRWAGLRAEDDPPPNDDDPPSDDPIVKVGDREFRTSELQTIMAREKREGKRSGASEVLQTLGFDKVEDLQSFVTRAKEREQADETEAQRKAREADERRKQADADAQTAAEERRLAQMERRLIRAGVVDDDDAALDDAVVLLQRDLDPQADDAAISDAVEKLKERRPELFGGTREETPRGRQSGQLPGGGKRKPPAPSQQPFGAGGLARAERRWGKQESKA